MKMIPVESCKECCLDYEDKVKLNCPNKYVHRMHLTKNIDKECPLDDIKEDKENEE